MNIETNFHSIAVISASIVLAVLLLGTISPLQAQPRVVPDQYATIQEAIDASNAGDTVLVRAGSYHEFLVMKDSVAVVAEGRDDGNWNRALRTIIHSDGLRNAEGKVPPVVDCADGSVIDGFTITGMDTVNHHLPGHSHAVQNRGRSGIIRNCIVHGNGSTGIGSHQKDGRPARPVIIHNKVYRNFGIGIGFNHFAEGVCRDNVVFENHETGIGTQNGASPLIENNTSYTNGWNGISARRGAKPVVRNNVTYDNGKNASGGDAPPGASVGIGADSTGWLVQAGDSIRPMIIEGNTVYNNPGGGIMTRNRALTVIRGNKSYDNKPFQIAVSERSVSTIENNTVYVSAGSAYKGGGIGVRGGDADIRGNTVTSTNGVGIGVIDGGKARITDNTISGNKLAGVRVDGSASDVSIVRNHLSRNQAAGVIVGSGTAVIHHNLVTENANTGISVEQGATARVYNNTIIAPTGAGGRGIYATSNADPVVNNIIVGYTVGIFKDGTQGIDYNCTYGNQGYNGPPGTGGQHAIQADPLFVDPANDDYHLQASSPCIDTGDPDPMYNDPDGSRADIGRFPYLKLTGINALPVDPENTLTAWPSAASDFVRVSYSAPGGRDVSTQVSVYNIAGKKIATVRLTNGSGIWDVRKAPAGMYFLAVYGRRHVDTATVFKIR